MNNLSFCIFVGIYAILVVTLLDCGSNVGCGVGASTKKPLKTTPKGKTAPGGGGGAGGGARCPKDMVHKEQFQMRMALCRPNISVICVAKPNNPCFKNRTKLKATAFVNRRNGQCLIESNVTSHRTLRFYVEAKRVMNPNAAGSRTLAGPHRHQRGKCLLKYICQKRFIRSITMECGSVYADENGALSNFTRERKFWVAPPSYKDFVHFSAEMAVTSDKRVLNISSAKIYIPGFDQQEKETSTVEPTDGETGNT